MPYESSKIDLALRGEQSIDFDNNLAEKEVSTEYTSHANEKEDHAHCNLNCHLKPQCLTDLFCTVSKQVAKPESCELTDLNWARVIRHGPTPGELRIHTLSTSNCDGGNSVLGARWSKANRFTYSVARSRHGNGDRPGTSIKRGKPA